MPPSVAVHDASDASQPAVSVSHALEMVQLSDEAVRMPVFRQYGSQWQTAEARMSLNSDRQLRLVILLPYFVGPGGMVVVGRAVVPATASDVRAAMKRLRVRVHKPRPRSRPTLPR